MFQTQTQTICPPCPAKPAAPCPASAPVPAPKFSAELMRMLAQLVMLR